MKSAARKLPGPARTDDIVYYACECMWTDLPVCSYQECNKAVSSLP